MGLFGKKPVYQAPEVPADIRPDLAEVVRSAGDGLTAGPELELLRYVNGRLKEGERPLGIAACYVDGAGLLLATSERLIVLAGGLQRTAIALPWQEVAEVDWELGGYNGINQEYKTTVTIRSTDSPRPVTGGRIFVGRTVSQPLMFLTKVRDLIAENGPHAL